MTPGSDIQSLSLPLLLSLAVGTGGGWVFHRIWRAIMPPTRSRAFWHALPTHVRGMIQSPDPDDLIRNYLALLVALGRFGGRNTLAIAAGLVPITCGYLLLDISGLPGRLGDFFGGAVRPYLDDFELCIFVAAMIGSAAAVWSARRNVAEHA